MTLALITAPTEEPISVAELKAHLRVDHSLDDALLASYLTGARQHVEGRDGWLGRVFITQTWELTVDRFPCGYEALEVPLPPLQSVTFVKYIDAAGVQQTWDSAKYTVDAKAEPGRIFPAYGEIYPATRYVPNAVTVRFIAGYGPAAAVPQPIKLGLEHLVAHWYENREPVLVGPAVGAVPLPMHVEALLAPFRIWGVV